MNPELPSFNYMNYPSRQSLGENAGGIQNGANLDDSLLMHMDPQFGMHIMGNTDDTRKTEAAEGIIQLRNSDYVQGFPVSNSHSNGNASLDSTMRALKWMNDIESRIQALPSLSSSQLPTRQEVGYLRSQISTLQSQQSHLPNLQGETQKRLDVLEKGYSNLQYQHTELEQRYAQLQTQHSALTEERFRGNTESDHHVHLLGQQQELQGGQDHLLEMASSHDRIIQALSQQLTSLEENVEHEKEETGEKLDQFLQYVSEGAFKMAKYIQDKFPDAPPFEEITALRALGDQADDASFS